MKRLSPQIRRNRIFTAAATLVFLLGLVCLNNCTGRHAANTNASAANANAASSAADAIKDNSEEFQQVVRLPLTEDEDVAWKETPADPKASPDATLTKRLIAVVHLTHENAAKLADELGRSHQPIAESLDPEQWYPAELIAQSNVSGDGKLSGKSYAADEFLLPPYTQGKITRIDNTDFFILELFGR